MSYNSICVICQMPRNTVIKCCSFMLIQAWASSLRSEYRSFDQYVSLNVVLHQKMTCFPVSTPVSISIYTLELENESSVTVTFTLFLNTELPFSPVKYPDCVLHRLLLSIRYPNVEEIYINVLVPFMLKKLPIAFWSVLSLNNFQNILLNDRKLQHSIQQSTINNQTRFDENSLAWNDQRPTRQT